MNINIFIGNAAVIATLIGTYFMFERGGEECWKALIPFYNSFTEYKMVWKEEMFWIHMACVAASVLFFGATFILPFVFESILPSILCTGMSFTMLGACLVIQVMESYHLSKHFGHGIGFTIGLVFMVPIFRCILGFEEKKIALA